MLKYKMQKVLEAQTYRTTRCGLRLAIRLNGDPSNDCVIWTGNLEGEPVTQIGTAPDLRELAQVLEELADFMEGIEKVPELEPKATEPLPASGRFTTSSLQARLFWKDAPISTVPRVQVNFGDRQAFNPQIIDAQDAEDLSQFFAALAKDLRSRS